MGLNVVAFKNARLSASEDAWHVYDPAPELNRRDELPEGRYEGDEQFRFRAGSYGGFNDWRNWLSFLCYARPAEEIWNDPAAFTGAPFFELINFSDCEGAFGPKTSAKLAADFRQYHDKVKEKHAEGSWERETYERFMMAFELAAQDGVLIFT